MGTWLLNISWLSMVLVVTFVTVVALVNKNNHLCPDYQICYRYFYSYVLCSSLLRGLSTFVGWFGSDKAQTGIRSVDIPYFVTTGVAFGGGGASGRVVRPPRAARSEKLYFKWKILCSTIFKLPSQIELNSINLYIYIYRFRHLC